MPKTYMQLDAADERFHKILDVLEQHHRSLKEAGLTLTVLIASGPRDANGDVCGPALTSNGYPAMATIKATSLKERAVVGTADALLTLDGDRIDELSEAQFTALIDHELYHLSLVTDKDGAIVRDDLGRPKLKMRKHDIVVGGFSYIVEKHKQNALEAMQVEAAYKTYVQPAFNFG